MRSLRTKLWRPLFVWDLICMCCWSSDIKPTLFPGCLKCAWLTLQRSQASFNHTVLPVTAEQLRMEWNDSACLLFAKQCTNTQRHTCVHMQKEMRTGWSTGSYEIIFIQVCTKIKCDWTSICTNAHTKTYSHTHIPLESAYWDNETMITAAYGSLSATSQRSLCVQSIRSLFSVIRVVIISRCVPLLRTLAVLYLLTPPLPDMASLNQAIIENEANSVVHQRTLTDHANDENSLACWKKCLHNLRGSSRRRCNANVCSFHPKATLRFCGDGVCSSVNCEPTQPVPSGSQCAECFCL